MAPGSDASSAAGGCVADNSRDSSADCTSAECATQRTNDWMQSCSEAGSSSAATGGLLPDERAAGAAAAAAAAAAALSCSACRAAGVVAARDGVAAGVSIVGQPGASQLGTTAGESTCLAAALMVQVAALRAGSRVGTCSAAGKTTAL